jgi:hypothetical protein
MLYTFLHLAFVAVANLLTPAIKGAGFLSNGNSSFIAAPLPRLEGVCTTTPLPSFAAGVAIAAPLPCPTAGVTEVDLLPHPAAGVADTRDPLPRLVAWVLATMPLPHLTVADDSLRSIGRCASRTP